MNRFCIYVEIFFSFLQNTKFVLFFLQSLILFQFFSSACRNHITSSGKKKKMPPRQGRIITTRPSSDASSSISSNNASDDDDETTTIGRRRHTTTRQTRLDDFGVAVGSGVRNDKRRREGEEEEEEDVDPTHARNGRQEQQHHGKKAQGRRSRNIAMTDDRAERIDAITAEPLAPNGQYVTITSPDGTLCLYYNCATLIRISLAKRQYLQPPHFREPMTLALKEEIRRKIGHPLPVVGKDGRTLAVEDDEEVEEVPPTGGGGRPRGEDRRL